MLIYSRSLECADCCFGVCLLSGRLPLERPLAIRKRPAEIKTPSPSSSWRGDEPEFEWRRSDVCIPVVGTFCCDTHMVEVAMCEHNRERGTAKCLLEDVLVQGDGFATGTHNRARQQGSATSRTKLSFGGIRIAYWRRCL